MMISSKGRYALRVMIDLAEHAERAISRCRPSRRGRGSPKSIWKAFWPC